MLQSIRLVAIGVLITALILPSVSFAQTGANPFLQRGAWPGCSDDELLNFAAEVYAYTMLFNYAVNTVGTADVQLGELTVAAIAPEETSEEEANCLPVRLQRQFLKTHSMAFLALINMPSSHSAFEFVREFAYAQGDMMRQLIAWSDSVLPAQSTTASQAPVVQSGANETRMYVRFQDAVVRGCPSRTCAAVRTAPNQVIVNGPTEGEEVDGSTLWYEVTVPNYRTPAGNVVTGYMHESMLSTTPP